MEFRQDVKSVFISVIGCHMRKISLKKQTDHDRKACPMLKVPDPEVNIVSVMIPAPVVCCYGYQRPILGCGGVLIGGTDLQCTIYSFDWDSDTVLLSYQR